MRVALEVVYARGHANVRGDHGSTFEITREPHLTPRGDCIIGVSADKAPADFSREFKEVACRDDSLIIALLVVGEVVDVAVGMGSSKLNFSDPTRMVFRRSSYTSGNTVMIRSNKAARDLSRMLVERMKSPSSVMALYLIAVSPICGGLHGLG